MIRACLSLLSLFLAFSASAQSAKVYDLITFKNPLEQAVFESLVQGDTNYLDLLLVAGSTGDSALLMERKKILSGLYQELDSAKLVRKKPKKVVSTVFKTVHDGLLKKYEFENQFSEVFETGKYNCVSATALYSYMLGGLGIPHYVIQTPDHVYALVLHRDQTWVIESTDPEQGYYRITDKTRNKALDRLVAQKMITPEQRDSPELDSILNTMFPEEAIPASKLVSIQYSNQGHYYLEKEKYLEAAQSWARAYVVHPDTAMIALLNMSLGMWLDRELQA